MAQQNIAIVRPEPQLGALATCIRLPGAMLGWLVEHFDPIALGVLLVAVAFPATPPTVQAVVGNADAGFWSFRLGPANALELMLAAVSALALVRAFATPASTSKFDRPLLGAALVILALQVFALPRHLADAHYIPLDLERLLIPVAAYLIVTRAIKDSRALRLFTFAVGAIICARVLQLVLVYGLTGATKFGTITGGEALLITEDTLLILFPLAIAWGTLIDGRLSLWGMVGAGALVSALLLIDVQSLRRGAMLLIGGALLARSLKVGKRRLLQGAAALAVILALSVAAGPGRPLLHQLHYTAVSSLLRTKDASSSQRTSEILSFRRNMDSIDWLTGKGAGVTWHAEVAAPLDALSFGPGETEFTRIGWHVYGLDWVYKFGLGGIAAILFALVVMGRQLLRSYREAEPALRSTMFSLSVCALPFILLLFTNPRVALMAGLTVGLLSRCCDLAVQTRTSPSGPEGSPATPVATSAA